MWGSKSSMKLANKGKTIFGKHRKVTTLLNFHYFCLSIKKQVKWMKFYEAIKHKIARVMFFLNHSTVHLLSQNITDHDVQIM